MRALISGITGQDGSYLAEMLLDKDYEVFGINRRTSLVNTHRISHLLRRITLIDADLCDFSSVCRAVKFVVPDETYNLGAQSYVKTSFVQPELTGDVTGLGVTRMLEATRLYSPNARFYQASSSEMFGGTCIPHSENSMFYPRSPYGCAKLYGYWITVNYRESYGLFACNGILMNHESPRRGDEFVTQKIAVAAADIKRGRKSEVRLGNMDAKRDWGHAKDFVRAMWLMLQQEKPDDYVIATGKSYSVRDLAEIAFSHVGLDYRNHVKVDEDNLRPSDIHHILGDASKATSKLQWKPEYSFEEMVREMVDEAMKRP